MNNYTDNPVWQYAFNTGRELNQLADQIQQQHADLKQTCKILRDAGEAIPVRLAIAMQTQDTTNRKEIISALLPVMQMVAAMLFHFGLGQCADPTDVRELLKHICFLQCDILDYLNKGEACG